MLLRSLVTRAHAALVRFFSAAPPPRRACVIDPLTAAEAVQLLRRVTRPDDGIDTLVERLVSLYTVFAPREACLQSLSMLVQLTDTGGEDNFACVTVYMAMTMALCERAREARERAFEAASDPGSQYAYRASPLSSQPTSLPRPKSAPFLRDEA